MATSELARWFWALPAGLFAYLTYRLLKAQRSLISKLPPGPKAHPILGNMNDFPPANAPAYEHWMQHKELYGPISSVTALGTTLVIVHDREIAQELLERKASKVSGRPDNVFANKLCGYESIMVCQSYTPTFRLYRKMLHQELGTKASAARFQDVQEVEMRRQLVRTYHKPENWMGHIRTTAAATTLKMTYGYAIEPHKEDPLVNLVEKMLANFSEAAMPMSWHVDLIPALQHLPRNFPGASFQRTARKWRHVVEQAAYLPYRFVQQQMKKGSHVPSYVSKLIDKSQQPPGGDGGGERALLPEDEHAIVWTATSLYGAAADTTAISLCAFTAAMVLYPDVQRKAQEEIDRVLGGHGQIPTFDDRERLPYVNAVVKETLRWWVVAPMGFPHVVEADVEYDGMMIPKGAMVLANAWWFLHDPEVYADPERFDPERFLGPRDEPDPAGYAFGFGRRICPGRFFADASIWIGVAQSLAALSFRKARKNGAEMDFEVKGTPGILSYPEKFPFQVAPRSEAYVDAIKKMQVEYPFEEGDAAKLGVFEG